MGVDLITHLPVSCGHDLICTYIDHMTGQTHLALTHDTVSAEGAADLHYKDVFRLHGILQKVHSDRGPQFAARFIQALYKHLGIETGFTTTFASFAINTKMTGPIICPPLLWLKRKVQRLPLRT